LTIGEIIDGWNFRESRLLCRGSGVYRFGKQTDGHMEKAEKYFRPSIRSPASAIGLLSSVVSSGQAQTEFQLE